MCSEAWESEERLITAHIEIDETNDVVVFRFDRNNPYHAQCGKNPEYLHKLDACFLAGLDGRFKLPVQWDDNLLKPYMFGSYLLPLCEWVYCYIKSGEKLGVSQVKGIELDVTETYITLSIIAEDIK